MNKETPVERIPYKVWANSQLSVAKHYGGININGKQYVLDYDNCPTQGANLENYYLMTKNTL